MILDKTGTLTYGRPALSEELYAPSCSRARPSCRSWRRIETSQPAPAGRRDRRSAAEAAGYAVAARSRGSAKKPGVGLHAQVGDSNVLVTSRAHAAGRFDLPPGQATGLECIVLIDDRYAATFRFHDVPRAESRGFVGHLGPKHGFTRVLLVSGDREAEVRRLADSVSIARDPRRHVAGRKGRDRAAGDGAARRRCSSATASTTRRR